MHAEHASRPAAARPEPLRYRTILAPTDFSPAAERAFGLALALARRHEAEVHLLHVMGPVEADAYSPLRHSPEARARQETPDAIIRDHLRAWSAKAEAAGVPVRTAKRHGGAVCPAILQYAQAEAVDLIAMGTHGRRGLPRMVLGSVAERVVREAPCSVLTVHAPPHGRRDGEALDLQRVLVPLDVSEHAPALLRAAYALAAPHGAQFDLLHVIEPVPFLRLMTGMMTVHDLIPDLAERVRAELRVRWDAVKPGASRAKLHVEEGSAAACIVDVAARCAADLVVVGARGHSAAGRFAPGRVAERVVRAADCPVLVHRLPDGAADDPPEALYSSEVSRAASFSRL